MSEQQDLNVRGPNVEEKSILQKIKDKLVDTFAPDETPYGKRKQDQVGNNLFQDVVVTPIKAALTYQKALGPRVLTPSQQKRKSKARAKRKLQRASRRANR